MFAGCRSSWDSYESLQLSAYESFQCSSSSAKALREAAAEGDVEHVQRLLAQEGPSLVDQADEHGATALLHATGFKLLKETGAEHKEMEKRSWPDEYDEYFQAFRLKARRFPDTSQVVTVLLAHGANVNAKTNPDGYSAVECAAYIGKKAVLEALLKAGAAVNAQDKEGDTALRWAATCGRTEIVQALLAAGADADLKNEEGVTALFCAAFRGHTEIVRVLLAADADVDECGIGGTALMVAAAVGHAEIVQALLAAGADVDLKDERDEFTALIIAAEHGHAEVVAELLEAGADVDVTNVVGKTALTIATSLGHTETVRVLTTIPSAAERRKAFLSRLQADKSAKAAGQVARTPAASDCTPAIDSWSWLPESRLPSAPTMETASGGHTREQRNLAGPVYQSTSHSIREADLQMGALVGVGSYGKV